MDCLVDDRKPLQKESLIEKAFQECNKAELVDLPAAVHQLLLLSDKSTHSTVLLVGETCNGA